VGTRYIFAAVRILLDPHDPRDVEEVHALQDAIGGRQPSTGSFEVPNWDQESQAKVRDALLSLSSTLPDLRHGGGSRDEIDPVRHLIATAAGWGLNPDKDAIYLNVTLPNNDGSGVYRLVVKDVPVDGFWSISVYDADGHFVKNDHDAYTLNNITAAKDPDDSVTVQFGGCDDATVNCLPIFPSWNYMVRLYRPRPEVLDGSWPSPPPWRSECSSPPRWWPSPARRASGPVPPFRPVVRQASRGRNRHAAGSTTSGRSRRSGPCRRG
jgi:hypothetical protein